mmetsp:Transcript_28797/g.40556  ORF Transcript_28797/g.40556 Transcript_28797/m.40556 type:complete len:199 (-) Transcript_28797:39-635(-)
MDTAQRRISVISNHILAENDNSVIEPQFTSSSAEAALRELVTRPHNVPKTISFDEFKGQLGKEIGISGWFEVTQERINAFADATGDHQWIHIDVERAKKESPFGGPIAHGFLTLSLIPFLVAEALPKITGIKMGVNYGLNKVRFVAPIPVGAKIRARVALQETTEFPGGVQSVLKVTLEKEGESKPAVVIEWITRYYV